MPDIPSMPEKPTTTGLLYHPFASGGRPAAPDTDGAVLSILIVTVTLIVMSPGKTAEHVMLLAAVSADNVLASQPVDDSGSGCNTQLTVTFDVYQPFEPSVPLITGVIVAVGALGLPAAPGGTSRKAAKMGRRR